MTGVLICIDVSKTKACSGDGNTVFFGGGNGDGNGLLIPRNGLLNGPAGFVKVTARVKGVPWLMRLVPHPARANRRRRRRRPAGWSCRRQRCRRRSRRAADS